jgi:hypothetical protein
MITTANLSTLLLSKVPFNIDDISALENYAAEMGFDAAILPGRQPSHDALRRIISARSFEQLESAVSGEILNYSPPTDENPYFFNMLRLNHPGSFNWPGPGVMRGNLAAHITLIGLIISLLVVSLWAIALPLWMRKRSESATNINSSILWSGAAYFSLIGAGFMFAEIGLIQRLSVFLGHPVYALGILLFTIIASAGLGSFISEKLPLTRPPWIFIYPLAIAVAVIAVRFALTAVASSMGESPIINRAVVSIMLIAPVGLLLGICFPTGMKLVQSAKSLETPWFWALNGIFGVLCSALAVFMAIHIGISANFYTSAACYLCLLLCIPGMYKVSHQISAKPD